MITLFVPLTATELLEVAALAIRIEHQIQSERPRLELVEAGGDDG